MIELVKQGLSIADSVDTIGISRSTYDMWRKRDPGFAERMDDTRAGKYTQDWPDLKGMTYREFNGLYLPFGIAPHQEPIADALDDPTVNKIMVTGFPESGKSTHMSLGGVLWKLAINPEVRIAIISKKGSKAEDILTRVKRYLTEPHLYETTQRSLIEDFNGFVPPRGRFRWDQTQITIRQREGGERDPTIQALGVGAQIYGARLDILLLDDALTLENQLTEARRAGISDWMIQEAMSRAHRGVVWIAATRIHPFDNLQEWHAAWKDDPHYRRIKIKAILDEWTDHEESSWPDYWPLDGRMVFDEVAGYERFQKGMREIRQEIMSLGEMRWRLVYQQEEVQAVDAIFTEQALNEAIDLGADRPMERVYPEEILVLGVDPAVTGRAAAVLVAYNPKTRVRTVVDIVIAENLHAEGIRGTLLEYFWDKYRPQRTVIEVNYAPTIMGDESLRNKARAYGTVLVPHSTIGSGHKRGSKWDTEYGVAAMAPLLNNGLIVFASGGVGDRERIQGLYEDMVAFPFSDRQDAVMALWFADGEMRYMGHGISTPEQQAQAVESRNMPPYLSKRVIRPGGQRGL